LRNNIDDVKLTSGKNANNPVDFELADRFEYAVSLTKEQCPELDSLHGGWCQILHRRRFSVKSCIVNSNRPLKARDGTASFAGSQA
jgi:hypothetical protein